MSENFIPVEWSRQTTIYEVNIRQYTPDGTIPAFAAHLPRLKDMGVETLWFMPLTPIAQKNRKGSLGSYYACSDFISINSEFGTVEDFKTVVKQAHEMGFEIMIDWVANHTGWDHIWTTDHPEYYLIDPETNDFKKASGMDDIIELDYKNPDLRKAMIDAMRWWINEFDIDGFRCDLAFWVELNFWKEARTELEKTKKLFWLGELDPLDNPEYMGTFDAAYTWTWMHKAKYFYHNGLTIADLDRVLNNYEALGNHAMRAWFTSNHDENSWNGTEYEKYGDMALALAVFSCTWNGIPLIYSGQELPNRKRLEFFEKDVINWSEKNDPIATGLHDFYKTLLTLHQIHPALRAGSNSIRTIRIKTSMDDQIFSFLKKKDEREVLVILNFSRNKNHFSITDTEVKGKFKEIFSNTFIDLENENIFETGAWGFKVYEK